MFEFRFENVVMRPCAHVPCVCAVLGSGWVTVDSGSYSSGISRLHVLTHEERAYYNRIRSSSSPHFAYRTALSVP
jgi:hypothetical protein